jgi:hypothetical protein
MPGVTGLPHFGQVPIPILDVEVLTMTSLDQTNLYPH